MCQTIFNILAPIALMGAMLGCSSAQINKVTSDAAVVAKVVAPVVAPIANAAINNEIANATGKPDSSYVVVKGDTLWSISVKLYGTGFYWPAIATSNAAVIHDVDCIDTGMTLFYFAGLSDQVKSGAKVTAYAKSPYVKHSCHF